MARYRLVLKPTVEKDLRSVPRHIAAKVVASIESLADEPVPKGVKKLEGAERTFRLRVGEYRLIYEFDKQKRTVIIQYVRHRSAAYR